MGAGGAAATFRILAVGRLVPVLSLPTAAMMGCSRNPSSRSLSAASSRCFLCLRMRSFSFSSLSSGWFRLRFSSRWEAEPGLVDGVLSPRRVRLGVAVTEGLDSWLSMLRCAFGVLSSSAGTLVALRLVWCPTTLRASRAGWSVR